MNHSEAIAGTSTSLSTADEVLMRCAPAAMHRQDLRHAAAGVIERDKAELLEVLHLFADGLEREPLAVVNETTGLLATYVAPETFAQLRRVLIRHCNRVVQWRGVGTAALAGKLESGQAESVAVKPWWWGLRCCDRAVLSKEPCVCAVMTVCSLHGSQHHGTHD